MLMMRLENKSLSNKIEYIYSNKLTVRAGVGSRRQAHEDKHEQTWGSHSTRTVLGEQTLTHSTMTREKEENCTRQRH